MSLTFLRDLPGFRGAVHFVLEPLGDSGDGVFAHLHCTDTAWLSGDRRIDNLSLLVTTPGVFWPHYEVRVDQAMVEELELSQPGDAGVLAIVRSRYPLTASTVNLYSPIIFNRRTGLADQLVPGVSEQEVGWSLHTPFPSEIGA
jgi:flagellar assembly factor FliW